MKRLLPLVMFLVIVLQACSTATHTFQCAFIVGRGVGDTYQVKHVVLPGERVALDPDDSSWFVPCNSRNYIMDKEGNGDTTAVIEARTAPREGNTLGTLVHIELSTYWELNQDREVLASFFEYCQKFACADSNVGSYEEQLVSNNSSEGWNEMLSETIPSSLSRAGNVAMAQFPDTIIDQPALWPQLADAMVEPYMAELRRTMGSGAVNLFCGSGSRDRGTCEPIRIAIDTITIVDPTVVQNRNEQARRQADLQLQLDRLADERQIFEQEKALERERAAFIAELYATPGYADERAYQAQLELIQACAEAQQKCVVFVGEQGDTRVEVTP